MPIPDREPFRLPPLRTDQLPDNSVSTAQRLLRDRADAVGRNSCGSQGTRENGNSSELPLTITLIIAIPMTRERSITHTSVGWSIGLDPLVIVVVSRSRKPNLANVQGRRTLRMICLRNKRNSTLPNREERRGERLVPRGGASYFRPILERWFALWRSFQRKIYFSPSSFIAFPLRLFATPPRATPRTEYPWTGRSTKKYVCTFLE